MILKIFILILLKINLDEIKKNILLILLDKKNV